MIHDHNQDMILIHSQGCFYQNHKKIVQCLIEYAAYPVMV